MVVRELHRTIDGTIGDRRCEPPQVATPSALEVVDDVTFTVDADRRRRRTSRCASATGRSTRCPSRSSMTPRPSVRPRSATARTVLDDAGRTTRSSRCVPNESYDGPRKPLRTVDSTSRSYGTSGSGLRRPALGDNLDIIDQVAGLGARAASRTTSATVRSTSRRPSSSRLTIPSRLAHFGNDEEGSLRRQAISYAINRERDHRR